MLSSQFEILKGSLNRNSLITHAINVHSNVMKIKTIRKYSPAESAGLLPGDEVTALNGHTVSDDIDILFFGAEEEAVYTVMRAGKEFSITLDGAVEHGIEFEPMDFISCGNNCIFCFVDQNPHGMRKPLYFKDEDYRLSFLHGAYVTMTTLRDKHLQRIVKQHLSPLYVSVHATDPGLRMELLGISRDDRLMEKIDYLVDSGIILHCQIVVCPGYNDGSALMQSIGDLHGRFPGIRSVAVVPVGLTKHRKGLVPLKAVGREAAGMTIDVVDSLHKEYMAKTGAGFVYCADEWYIRAGREVPCSEYYDDFPQIENGVGMLRDFLDSTANYETRGDAGYSNGGKYSIITGVSMSGYMSAFAKRLSVSYGIDIGVVTVVNRFYGDSVTVSGLLTGGDIIEELRGTVSDETVILPPNCLNDSGIFLDDVSPDDISAALGVKIIQELYDPAELIDRIV